MGKEIIYIAETKQFIVDGTTISEESLSETEARELKMVAEAQKLLVGSSKDICSDERLLV